ncbi:MAG: MerR family transcriptional regulator [Thermodesulfobacteriota bacterium]|nr:MerR family transcriptional regulator [Thermodesulfobacteriota bacterium]
MKAKVRTINHLSLPIPEKLYYKIGEVSEISGVEPYVLRYWETEFDIVKPFRTRSKQRLYRKKDLDLILAIKKLLYEEQFTIAGAKRKLKEYSHKHERASQLSLSRKEYKRILKTIKEELETIKKVLE